MEIRAKWKVELFKADATTVANEIKSIGDEITPKQIVDYARNENSELHKCFTWDDTKAAEKWRLQEARQVVCQLQLVTVGNDEKEEPTPLRVFYKTDNSEGYKPTQLIVQNMDEYGKLLAKAKEELQTFKAKYKAISELEKVFEAIDEL